MKTRFCFFKDSRSRHITSFSEVKTQSNGKLPPVGADGGGGGREGWLTSACAPSLRMYTHLGERDFMLFGQGLHWLL